MTEIKIAEKFNDAGNEMFERLSAEFIETYRGKTTPV